MESFNLIALSEKQIEDLRNIFVDWYKDEEISETLSFAGIESHNDIAKLFVIEVAGAIICDVSIMTKEERDNDRMNFYCSMEGLEM
jgi:hypothetical protein